MRYVFAIVLGALPASLAGGLTAGEPRPPSSGRAALPAWEVPLPRGAVYRIGTTRLRMSGLVEAVAFAPDGKSVAALDLRGRVAVWDRAMGRLLCRVEAHPQVMGPALAFTPDGRRLFTAGNDSQIGSYDPRTGKAGPRYQVVNRNGGLSGYSIYCLAVSPDGKALAAGCWGLSIRLWDLTADREEERPLLGHEDSIKVVAFSPDSKVLASGGDDKTVRLWDLATRKELHRLGGQRTAVQSLAFAPGGKALACAAGQLSLWDPATGKRLAAWGETEGEAQAVAFSPDGKLLASAHEGGQVCLWEADTRQLRRRLRGHGASVTALAFAPDGRALASGGADATVRLWDVATGADLFFHPGHQGRVAALALTADGTALATGCQDGVIRLWDAATGRLRREFRGHRDTVNRLALSPDGRSLASAGWQEEVRLWDVASGQELHRLGDPHFFTDLAFARGGRWLLSAAGHPLSMSGMWPAASTSTGWTGGSPRYSRWRSTRTGRASTAWTGGSSTAAGRCAATSPFAWNRQACSPASPTQRL